MQEELDGLPFGRDEELPFGDSIHGSSHQLS